MKKVAHWLKLLMRHAHLPGTEPTGVEPCLGGTVRASGEQDGTSHRKNACQIEVGTTETTGIQ